MQPQMFLAPHSIRVALSIGPQLARLPSIRCLAMQGSGVRLMATAGSAADGRMKLEALEAGVGGILLRTDDPLQAESPGCQVQCLTSCTQNHKAGGTGGGPWRHPPAH